MKIKSIKKVGERLFLITYKKLFGRVIKRYVIQTRDHNESLPFYFRDDSNPAWGSGGQTQLTWMVENNVDYFDNDEEVK